MAPFGSHRRREVTVRRLPALLVLVLLVAGCGPGRVAPDQAAVVDGAAIPMDALSAQVKAGRAAAAQPDPAQAVSGAREALQGLIVARVVLDGAEQEGVTVSDADVDARLEQIKQQVAAQGQDFEAALAQRNLTVAVLRDQLRVQLAAEKLSAKLVPGKPDEELLASLGGRKAEFLQLRVRHILVGDQATARKVKSQLEAGGDWAALARRYSIDPGSKQQGGDLGFQGKGATVAPFEKAAVALAGRGTCKDRTSGDCASPIGGPVKTEFGWHVLQVTGVRLPPLDENLRNQLEPSLQSSRQKAVQEWFSKRIKAASVQVNPRFGRWDAASGRIVDRATGTQPPAAPTTAPPGAGAPPTTAPR
jgi:parvulin-like peptidyl-prolyl isomerase